jgi:tetraacyldisaccharide 4'-kinase
VKRRRINPLAGPLPGVLDPLAWVASRAYRTAIDRRNREFDAGVGVERLPLPVISVGNISTGGTGKTPLVMYLARLLHAHDRKPIIAMRGYKAQRGGESDEEAEYRQRLPDVTVLANPRRYETVRAHLERGGAGDCVLLDDGFQHRALGRNLDLVVIDATRPFMLDRLLPAGYLREPAESLGRADGVIVSRSHHLDEPEREALARAVERSHGRPPVAWSAPRWSALNATEARCESQRPIDDLAGLRVLSVCGIGNPAAFVDQLRAAGAEIVEQINLRDHHPYPRRFVERLLARATQMRAQAIVTTAKDWTKLRQRRPAGDWPLPILRPVLELEMQSGEAALTRLVLDAVQGGP